MRTAAANKITPNHSRKTSNDGPQCGRILAFPAFKNRLVNPYNWLLYSNLTHLGAVIEEFSLTTLTRPKKYDIFHLHWPEGYLDRNVLEALTRTFALVCGVLWFRINGVKIVWTAHNIRSHENRNPRLQTLFWKFFPKLLSGWISLSESGRQQVEALIPHLRQVPSFVIPHGHYKGEYPVTVTRDEARTRLGVAQRSRVMLSFGRISGYKNLPLLVNSLMKMPGADVILFVAGFPECSQTAESLGRLATLEPRLRLELHFIKENEVQLFFKSADLIVLPYREILNSGVALLALSFNRPILAPAIGALPELQALVSEAWVRCYSGELTPEKLDAALGWAVYANRNTGPCLEDLNWAKLARETLLAYELVASNQRGTGRRKSGPICARALRTRHR